MMNRRIDFQAEFAAGPAAYDGNIGKWWVSRCEDQAHARAYRLIADRVQSLLADHPSPLLVDYACGAGNLLSRLYRRLPAAAFVGLDASSLLLERAAVRMRRIAADFEERLRFVECPLPSFRLPGKQADCLLLTFPNIVPSPSDSVAEYESWIGKKATVAAWELARAREQDPAVETVTLEPESLYLSLLAERAVSRELHHLLKPGGWCVRVTYANAPRHYFTNLVRDRLAFEEGSLRRGVVGPALPALFDLIESSYHRSKTVQDVFFQTGDATDLKGGFLITVLQAR